MNCPRVRLFLLAVAATACGATGVAAQETTTAAQDQLPEHQHELVSAPAPWNWTADANAFYGYNYQQRHFADFSAWESQNWLMVSGDRPFGARHLSVNLMFSGEALTLHQGGSPQLFQTGESYKRTPLVNEQHPHDFLMGAGAAYRFPRGRVTYSVEADLVGAPTLGPTPFMHRESARDNPEVPLSHHDMDSTHISYGVLRAGVDIGRFTLEGSAFRGQEPDENRWNVERPRLDSYAGRIVWHAGAWQAQVSAGHLKQPEWFEPYDITRLTASLAFDGEIASRPLHATLAWGENREFNGFNGNNDGYLLEWDLRATGASTFYGRTEVVDKELFGLGAHPKGLSHRHVFYTIGAVTIGYVRDLSATRLGRLGIGADATLYHMPEALDVFWEGSHSYHMFLRWRPRTGGGSNTMPGMKMN